MRFGTHLPKRAKEAFDTTFKGDVNKVFSRVNKLKSQFDSALIVYEAECRRCGVHSIGENWLEKNARNSNQKESYKGKVQTKIKNASEPIPMEDIPPYKPRNNR